MTNLAVIALNKTVLSPLNMRQGDVDVSDLVATMKARVQKGLPPLIQNMGATWQLDAEGKPTGIAEIHVGGRRLRALNELAKAKVIKKTFELTVAITESREEAIVETSEENDARLPPHPVDQYENFARMIAAGHTLPDIAARFSIPVDRVIRRLKLAKVSPRLLDLYRADVISYDQVTAFTLTDDHAAQEAAYFDQPEGWQRSASGIRKSLTKGEVNAASDVMAKFVGLDAYRAAGGAVRVDLFSTDGEGFIQDPALLQRLAGERLAATAAEVEAEGWKWVRTEVAVDWQELDGMGRVYPQKLDPSPEVVAQIEELSVRYQAMEAEGLGETDEGAEAMDALEAQITVLEKTAGEAFSADDMSLAGVLVYIDRTGTAKIHRGLIAQADKKAHEAITKARQAASAADAAQDGDTAGLAGVQASTAGEGLSATMRENLSAHHSMALRAALIDAPNVALVATVHRMLLVGHYRHDTSARDHGALRIEGLQWNETLEKHVPDIRESKAGEAVAAAREAHAAILPEKVADLWDYLIALPLAEVLSLLAYAASYQVFAVQAQYAPQARAASAYQLAEALSLDMADYWTPTVPGYFGRVGKAEIVSAVREAKGEVVASGLSAKKADMADEAADLLADSRWVPAMLRTRGVGVDAVAADSAPLADAA